MIISMVIDEVGAKNNVFIYQPGHGGHIKKCRLDSDTCPHNYVLDPYLTPWLDITKI